MCLLDGIFVMESDLYLKKSTVLKNFNFCMPLSRVYSFNVITSVSGKGYIHVPGTIFHWERLVDANAEDQTAKSEKILRTTN